MHCAAPRRAAAVGDTSTGPGNLLWTTREYQLLNSVYTLNDSELWIARFPNEYDETFENVSRVYCNKYVRYTCVLPGVCDSEKLSLPTLIAIVA